MMQKIIFSLMQYIRAEKHIHLNREESPCTNYEEIGTTFVDCVSKKIMDQSGCKVKGMLPLLHFGVISSYFSCWATMPRAHEGFQNAKTWKKLHNI